MSSNMAAYLLLAAFLILTFGGGLLIGFWFRPGEWYTKLAKPWFTPPNGVFAPVWTLLYIMIAVVGWRTFEREPFGTAMAVWTIALALNFIWSPIFLARTGQGPHWPLSSPCSQ